MTLTALVFDFETTGLPFHPNAKPVLQPRAIEFAGCIMAQDGTVLSEHNWLIHPGMEVSAEITKITGITNAMLATAEPFVAGLDRLRLLCAGADVLVAHNLPFDHSILAHELATVGALQGWPWPAHGLCTVQTYEPMWGRRPKLTELFEAVTGDTYQQTHRALDDVRALVTVVAQEKLLDLIASTPGSHGIQFPTGFRADQPGGRAAG